MTRLEKAAQARELRDQGLLQREIAERMGAAISTVDGWLHDPDGARLRARKDSYRGTCETCGQPTNGSEGRGPRRPVICGACQKRRFVETGARAAKRRARPRYERIAELWVQGRTLRYIAADLNTSEATVATAVHRMREQGWNLPYRRKRAAA